MYNHGRSLSLFILKIRRESQREREREGERARGGEGERREGGRDKDFIVCRNRKKNGGPLPSFINYIPNKRLSHTFAAKQKQKDHLLVLQTRFFSHLLWSPLVLDVQSTSVK
jgi:hypothetical protein